MAALKTYILDEKMDNCCYAKEIKNTKIAEKNPNDDSEQQTFLFKENIFSSEIIILFGDVFGGGFFINIFPLVTFLAFNFFTKLKKSL